MDILLLCKFSNRLHIIIYFTAGMDAEFFWESTQIPPSGHVSRLRSPNFADSVVRLRQTRVEG